MQAVYPEGSLTWACQARGGGGKLLLPVLGEGKMIFIEQLLSGGCFNHISDLHSGYYADYRRQPVIFHAFRYSLYIYSASSVGALGTEV